ncbi:MAG: hypothetical protein J6B10_05665 [Lachnospiraceae bacterium]|nr:hypothetical protein [Lachnospiraceae bacterium]
MKKLWKYLMTLSLLGVMFFASALTVSAKELDEIFDADYYLKANQDLVPLYGNDADALYAHFIRCGIREGRQCSPLFDLSKYKEAHPELVEQYGFDNIKYYEYYLNQGIEAGQSGEGLFDAVTYANAYPDLKATFGYDLKALYNHFLTIGIYEGRLKGLNFNYWCYGALNPELGKSYAEHPEMLYLQYLNEGLQQGLKGARSSAEYRYIYCDPDGYGGKDAKHLIKKWTVGRMPEGSKKGYDEAYCEVCGQHFQDEMDMNDYYVKHLHMPDSDLNHL